MVQNVLNHLQTQQNRQNTGQMPEKQILSCKQNEEIGTKMAINQEIRTISQLLISTLMNSEKFLIVFALHLYI